MPSMGAFGRATLCAKQAENARSQESRGLGDVYKRQGNLLAKLSEMPRVVASAAEFREPHRIARYLEEVAGAYHRWYDSCRVTPLAGNAVDEVHRTRLWLNNAAGVVLRNGLYLLGVSAPERM